MPAVLGHSIKALWLFWFFCLVPLSISIFWLAEDIGGV